VRVRVGDVRLYFDVAGMELVPDGSIMRERPVVVCLHGGPGFDHSTLKPFLGPLEDEAQLIFLDHRGQGRSDESTPSRWNLDTWIDDVAAFCDVLGIERPIILGQSFGGMVGLGVAIRYPELRARLVVSSSLARFRPERALAMFEELGGEEARDVAARFFRNPNQESFDAFMVTCFPLYGRAPRDPDVRARVRFRPEVNFHFFGGELKTFDWFDDLNRIRCPTLILAGEVDPIATVLDHEELAAAISGSRLEVFSDAGHGVFRDKPDQALAIIRDFIHDPAQGA
jgi:pimeloyl-ACP methyl ester carboxylesterase